MKRSPQRELPDRIVSHFFDFGVVRCCSISAASSESRNTHTFLTVPVPSGYAPAKPLRASARSWRLFTDRNRAASSAETNGSGALTVSKAIWEGLTRWRVRHSSNNGLVSDMFCSSTARRTRCEVLVAGIGSDRRRRYSQSLLCKIYLDLQRISVKRPHWADVRSHLRLPAKVVVFLLAPAFLCQCERFRPMVAYRCGGSESQGMKSVQTVYAHTIEGMALGS